MATLTEDEARAIKALQKLAKTWPDSLWLFSGSGSLCVMKKDGNGDRAMGGAGGYDPNAEVATVNIENDGGDW